MKDIVGFEGYYKATKGGRIYSVKSGRFLKQNLKPTGYLTIEFNVNGETSYHRVHRLIALTFIPNPHNKPYVNHIDGDKSNNHINNLEWATESENTQHSVDTGLSYFYVNVYEIICKKGSKTVCKGSQTAMQVVGVSKNTLTKYTDSGKFTKTGYMVNFLERATTISSESTAKRLEKGGASR